jgi:hypothetical protein
MDEQDYPRGSYSAFVKDASSAFDDAVRPRHFFYGGDDGEAEVREVAAAAAAAAAETRAYMEGTGLHYRPTAVDKGSGIETGELPGGGGGQQAIDLDRGQGKESERRTDKVKAMAAEKGEPVPQSLDEKGMEVDDGYVARSSKVRLYKIPGTRNGLFY